MSRKSTEERAIKLLSSLGLQDLLEDHTDLEEIKVPVQDRPDYFVGQTVSDSCDFEVTSIVADVTSHNWVVIKIYY